MIQLYLHNYKPHELVDLYNALQLVRSALSPNNIRGAVDIDSALDYLTGYMDAKGDDGK